MFLVGDIGATKVRFALFDNSNNTFERLNMIEFQSNLFTNLEAILQNYLKTIDVYLTCAVFGVPGPVIDGEVKTTNLPWIVNIETLKKTLSLSCLNIVNDLESVATAIPFLEDSQIKTIYQSNNIGLKHRSLSKIAVIAPGTGLGQCFLYLTDKKEKIRKLPLVFPSEGGHVDFAPRNKVEMDLLNYLKKKYQHVSYEHILSGIGIRNIYHFFRENSNLAEPTELKQRLINEDFGKVVTETALNKKDLVCLQTMNLFLSVLGAQAANLALTYFSTGGVYISGGIPPKIVKEENYNIIVKNFLAKGRLSSLLSKIPIYLIIDDTLALLGAALIAKNLYNNIE